MRLTNGIVAFEFDPRTGGLAQIEDLRTAKTYLAQPGCPRLLRIYIPDKDHWTDRYCDSHESPPPQMHLRGHTLSITFPDLKAADGNFSGVAATVRVRLAPGDDEAHFTLELDNRGPFTVCEVMFPWVGGWSNASGPTLWCGWHNGLDLPRQLGQGWHFLGLHKRRSVGFPHANIPMCHVAGSDRSLSYNFYPRPVDLGYDLAAVDLSERGAGPRPTWAWVQRPFLKPDAQWTSSPVGIAPHAGDWHVAADKMRAWVKQWWRPPPSPAGLRQSIGFHNAFFRDFGGLERRSFADLPRLARFGQEHGLDHFCVWDTSVLGLYLRAGSTTHLGDQPARMHELRRALADTRALGVQVSTLLNLRLLNQDHGDWKAKGEPWALRTMYGQLIAEPLPYRRNSATPYVRYLEEGTVRLCQSHRDFEKWAVGQVRQALDLGFSSIFIDQPFSEDYCFAENHGHPVPTAGHEGVCRWVDQVAKMVRAHHPDSYVIGEVPDLWNTQICDMWWYWDWGWAGLRAEVVRYILPDSIQSWVLDAYEHEHEVGKAFAMGHLLNIQVRGLELCLEDVPEFAQRIKRLAALRRKTHACTVDGQFRDRQGLSVESSEAVSAYLYDAGPARGITLANNGTQNASVKLSLSPDLRPTQITLHQEDDTSTPLPTQSIIELQLPLRQCAVVEVRL